MLLPKLQEKKTQRQYFFVFNNIVVCNIFHKSRLFILVVQLTENSGYKLSQTSYKLTRLQAYLHSKMLFHPSWVIILPSYTPDINTSTPGGRCRVFIITVIANSKF